MPRGALWGRTIVAENYGWGIIPRVEGGGEYVLTDLATNGDYCRNMYGSGRGRYDFASRNIPYTEYDDNDNIFENYDNFE